ncbi:MAG: prepilin-type N-terminal cleavage/methylation domain-containing protein [Thermodesulfovibrionales bacterium]
MKHTELEKEPVCRNECEGFTLLEVLVAMALLSISLVAIFELFSADLRGIAKSDDYSHAVIMAESKMRKILDDDTLKEQSWTESTDDGYRIDAVVSSTASDRTENLQIKLLEINLKVSWIKDSKDRTFNLKTVKMVNKQI